MKRLRLRARDRRALLLGLIIVTPFAVYRVVVEPWIGYRSGLRDALVSERDLLAREQAMVRDAAELPRRAGELEVELADAHSWLLDAGNAVTASGRLTRIISEAAQASGILVQEVRAGESEPVGPGLEGISLSVRALGDIEGIARFLFTLENGESLVRVEELSLHTAGMNDGDVERGQLMSAGLVVAGFWRHEPDVDRSRASPSP